MAKKTSVTINGISYDADFAMQLGKAEWVKEVSASFESDAKAGEAFDTIAKTFEDAKKDEADETARVVNANKIQADAQSKLDARTASKTVKSASPTPGKGI